MAATLHCYHLAALLQPEESPSAGRLQLAAALSTLAQNLDVSTLPATLPEASARDTANGVILQEMARR
jgi:multidrug resistance protein MdtO